MINGAAYCLEQSARHHRDKPALMVLGDRAGGVREHWSFGAVRDQVLAIAAGLRERGLARGDRVLLRIGNSSDFPLMFFGTIAAGGVAVPTSSQLTAPECDRLVRSCEPRFIVHDGVTVLPADPGAARMFGPCDIAALKSATAAGYAAAGGDDPAFLVYTSGTGGAPKGVLHAHRAIPGRAPMYRGWYGLSADDRLLHAGAFNWTYTLGAGLMDPWANGATSIVYDGDRAPEVWPALIAASGATLFAAVPSLYRRILKYGDLSPARLASLRHGLVAGEALPASLYRQWLDRTGLPLFEALGMSEISTYISSGPDVPTRPGSPGKPQPGRRVAILAEEGGTESVAPGTTGLLCVHGSDPAMMLGYWRDAAATRAAFRGDWFVTGDRARFDADGYVWHEGRADDVMNAFGYRVAPDEIERVLAEHPAVAEVAVTDIQAGPGVSLITAFVVPATGSLLDHGALDAWCGERLAAYKRPKSYVTIDQLPRTPSGKVQRRQLRLLPRDPA